MKLERCFYYGVNEDFLDPDNPGDDGDAYMGGIVAWIDRPSGELFVDEAGTVPVKLLDLNIIDAKYMRIKLVDGTPIANPDCPEDSWGRPGEPAAPQPEA